MTDKGGAGAGFHHRVVDLEPYEINKIFYKRGGFGD